MNEKSNVTRFSPFADAGNEVLPGRRLLLLHARLAASWQRFAASHGGVKPPKDGAWLANAELAAEADQARRLRVARLCGFAR